MIETGRLQGVVFDLDGTLLDTMTSVPTAYAETIRRLGGPDVGPARPDSALVAHHPAELAELLGVHRRTGR